MTMDLNYRRARNILETELRSGKVRGQRAKELAKDILNCVVSLRNRYHKIDINIIRENSFARDGPGVPHLVKALVILEVYGKNLLKQDRPAQWRIIRKSNPKFNSEVAPVKGHQAILKLLGYTEDVADGLAFPENVLVPDVPVVAAVTADIVLLRQELMLVIKDRHPRVDDVLVYLSREEIANMQEIMRHPPPPTSIEVKPTFVEQNISVSVRDARHPQQQEPIGVAPLPTSVNQYNMNAKFTAPNNPPFASFGGAVASQGRDVPEAQSMPYQSALPINTNRNTPTTVANNKSKTKGSLSPPPTSDEDVLDEPGSCDICGENEARYECLKCSVMQKLCRECDARIHKHPKRRNHQRALLKFDVPQVNLNNSQTTNPLQIRPKEQPNLVPTENNVLPTPHTQVNNQSPFSSIEQHRLNRQASTSNLHNRSPINNYNSEFTSSSSLVSTPLAPKSLTAGDWDQKVAELIDITNEERRKEKSQKLLDEINQKINNYHRIMEEIRMKNPNAHSLVNHINEKIEELKMTRGVVETLCQENQNEFWNDDKYEVESFDTTPAIVPEREYDDQQHSSNLSNVQPEVDQDTKSLISVHAPSNMSNNGGAGSSSETSVLSINASKRKHDSQNDLISLDPEENQPAVSNSLPSVPSVNLIDVEKTFLPAEDNDEVTTTKALNTGAPEIPPSSLLDAPINDQGLAQPAFQSMSHDPFAGGDMTDIPYEFSSISFNPGELQELMKKETKLYETMIMVESLRSRKRFSPEQISMANKVMEKEGIMGETPVAWLEKNWDEHVLNAKQFTDFPHVSNELVSRTLLKYNCEMENTVTTLDKQVDEMSLNYPGYATKEVIAAVADAEPGNVSQQWANLEKDTRKLLLQDLEEEEKMEISKVFVKAVNSEHASCLLMAKYHWTMSKEFYAGMVKIFWMAHSQELNETISDGDIMESVRNTETSEEALAQLDKECMICLEHMAYTKINCMPTCGDNGCAYCSECLFEHFKVCIRDKNIRDITCPVCGLPDIDIDEETATNHFTFLDVTLRNNPELYNLFQQKLRDFTLQRMPKFRWCSHCTGGFQFEPENQGNFKMICPYCNKSTCYKCKKQWEEQHEGISCEQFQEWKEQNDPEYQEMGLAAHLKENGIDCPYCNFRYALAKGGCMHFRCSQCSHEFCSGCNSAFKQARACTKNATCANRGLHAHHPRDCLFYLRDCSVDDLQKLLKKHNVQFNIIKDGDKNKCQVMEQKELPNGYRDAICGRDVVANQGGLCDLHYKEYLVSLVNKKELDPAEIFDINALQTCLRREEVAIPNRRNMDNKQYKAILLNEVKKLPLQHQRNK